MADQIKDLIEKIQEEGVQAAEAKAGEIEKAAQARAEEIIARAKKDAQKILAEAKEAVARMQASAQTALAQAGRDLLLKLRAEIEAVLKKLILLDLRAALTPVEVAKIITHLVESVGAQEKSELTVILNKQDLKEIEKSFLAKLSAEIQKGLTLKSSDAIQAGFIISYDREKSHFDFTDERLAEYLGACLKPKLSEILNQAASTGSKDKG